MVVKWSTALAHLLMTDLWGGGLLCSCLKAFWVICLQMTFSASPYSDPILVKTERAEGLEQAEMLWVMGPVLAVVLIIVFVIGIILFKK